MKFAHALSILIIGCIFNFTDVYGQGIAQTVGMYDPIGHFV